MKISVQVLLDSFAKGIDNVLQILPIAVFHIRFRGKHFRICRTSVKSFVSLNACLHHAILVCQLHELRNERLLLRLEMVM